MEILVAEVTDDLRRSRKRLIQELKKSNIEFRINIDIPPPYIEEEHDEILMEVLNRCEFTIHILGPYSGRPFDNNDEKSILVSQGIKGIKSNCKNIFWMPKGLDIDEIDDDDYKEFVSELEFGIDKSEENYQFIKGDPQTLAIDIAKEVIPKETLQKSGDVLIVYNSKDEKDALVTKKTLADKGINSTYNSSRDSGDNLEILGDQLTSVNKVIIVVGEVNHEWADKKIKHIFKHKFMEDLPIESIAILFTPAAKSTFEPGKLIKVDIIDMSQEESYLDGFLDHFIRGGDE